MAEKILKTLHIMSGFGGGISSFIRNKAEYVSNENIQFDVVTYDETPPNFKKAIKETGGAIYTLKNPKTTSWKTFRESYTRVLQGNVYDIIHCHINGYRILPYYYYAQKYSDAAFYVHAHSSHYPKEMLSTKQQASIRLDQFINKKMTDSIVGCGSLSIQNIFGSHIQKDDMVVIPNSVEVERFIHSKAASRKLRNDSRKKFGLKEDEVVIGHIGRLETVKNHELTIELAKSIKLNNLSMKILIIGEGNRETELKNKVNEANLTDIIQFTGRISPIENFFPALDAVILPSFSEGLPTTVVEAQASGVPVVMSDTITTEVDLGFDMIETVALDAHISQWLKAIQKTQTMSVPDEELREAVIKEKKFSNDASAELYMEFLRGNVKQYTID